MGATCRRDGLIEVAQDEEQVLTEKRVEGGRGEVIERDAQIVGVRMHLLPPGVELLRARDSGDGQCGGRDGRCHTTLLVYRALPTRVSRPSVPRYLEGYEQESPRPWCAREDP